MRILFITKGDRPDYQHDMVFHGLRKLYGENVVDSIPIWYMYKETKLLEWPNKIEGKGYGCGYTVPGTLDMLDSVDRTDLPGKISGKYFDLIVYGSCRRCLDYIGLVTQHYKKERIIFIDGEDDCNIDVGLPARGKFFKRELPNAPFPIQCSPDLSDTNIFPICFSIPSEKIATCVKPKHKFQAGIIPGKLDTYIFGVGQEDLYYKDYQESWFGLTCKKGGWDCLRHYEIMANGCIPFFPGIEQCPVDTMFKFPKKKTMIANNFYLNKNYKEEDLIELSNYFLSYTRDNLTTIELAKYVLTVVKCI